MDSLRNFEQAKKLIEEVRIELEKNKKPSDRKTIVEKYYKRVERAIKKYGRQGHVHIFGNSNGKTRSREDISRQLEGLD